MTCSTDCTSRILPPLEESVDGCPAIVTTAGAATFKPKPPVTGMKSKGRPRLDWLTRLRFFAALMVVLLHSVSNAHNDVAISKIPILDHIASVGYLGVTFFFVLSGFVLSWSAPDRDTAWAFLQRRFARIYPVHFATWAMSGVGQALLAPKAGGLLSIFMPLVLLQSWFPYQDIYFGMNGVSWSLSDEFFYYAMFPIFLAVLRIGRLSELTVGALAFLVSLLASLAALSLLANTEPVWVNPLFGVMQFIVGVAAGWATRKGFRLNLPPLIAVTICVVSYGALAEWDVYLFRTQGTLLDRPLASTLFIVPMVVLLLSMASYDLNRNSQQKGRDLLVRLGDWSFGLYMIHPLILAFAVRVLHVRPSDSLPQSLATEIVFVVICVLASGAFYRFYEMPLERRLRPAP